MRVNLFPRKVSEKFQHRKTIRNTNIRQNFVGS